MLRQIGINFYIIITIINNKKKHWYVSFIIHVAMSISTCVSCDARMIVNEIRKPVCILKIMSTFFFYLLYTFN